MELKQIEILGFKSFADKIILPFHKEEWITAIVGPNGCGKSNIADAFQWVLGEQSPRSMRAQERVDVIFSGTAKRKPLNFAEVTLVFIDNDHQLPLEYTSVAVTRRMYRNGESDYLINGHPVRLKDIHDLFLDSGLGRNSYAIFKQGKMDQLIQMSPEERREILMKAAGIERFMEKKAESEKKLAEADTNMQRVRDLLLEVQQRRDRLVQEAQKAKVYQEKKEEVQYLAKAIFFARWQDVEGKVRELTQELDEKTGQCHKEEKQLKELTLRQKELQEVSFVQQDAMQEEKEKWIRFVHQKEFHRKEREKERERQEERKQKKKILEKEKEESFKEKVRREKEKEELEKKIKDSTHKIHIGKEECKELEEKVEKCRKKYQEWRWQMKAKAEEKTATAQKESLLYREKQQFLWKKEQEDKTLIRLQQQLVESCASKEEIALQKGEEEAIFGKLENDIIALQDKILDSEQALLSLEKQNNAIFQQLQNEQEEFSRFRTRKEVLQKMQEAGEGLSEATQRLLAESTRSGSPVFAKLTPIYQLLRPKKGQEKAVAHVLHRYRHTFVVETEKDLWEAIRFCRMEGILEFAFLCKEKLSVLTPRAARSFSEKVRPHPLAPQLLDGIEVVEFIDEVLLQMQEGARKEIWCEEGLFLDQNGVLFQRQLKEGNLFLRQAEIEELENKISVAQESVEKISQTWQQVKEKKEKQRQNFRFWEQSLREFQLQAAERRTTLRHLCQEEERRARESKDLSDKILIAEKKRAEFGGEVKKLEEQHALASKLREQAEGVSLQIEGEADRYFQEVCLWEEEKKNRDHQVQGWVEEQRVWILAQESLVIQQQEAKKEEERWHQKWMDLERDSEKSEEAQEEMLKEIAKLQMQEQDAHKQCEEAKKKAEESRDMLRQLDDALQQGLEKKKQSDIQLQRLQIQVAELRTCMEELEKEKQELFLGVFSPHQASLFPLDRDLESAERRLRRLRQEVVSMNDINMNAAAEYEEHVKKGQYLQKQVEDYEQSRGQFEQIIANLEGESRKKLRMTFTNICSHFQRNFSLLFGGGEAELLLTESNDILAAGIEVVARPPGKQMRSIQLLSGGEKCMTAIALLFALFEEKPSPFCLLDEIDAPLDETNVDRFLELLKTFADRCQFLLITHNKRTMKIANRLVGISMEEKGVSKVLTMKMVPEKQHVVIG